MNMKLVGIIFSTLLITTFVLPVTGNINDKVVIEKNFFKNETDMEYVPGEFIVKLKKDIALSQISFETLNDKYQVHTIDKIFPNSEGTILENIYILRVPLKSDILSIVNDYALCSNVVFAEPNRITYLCGIPNDANFSKQWYLNNNGQEFKPGIYGKLDADIDASEVWDIETGSSDVMIAIIDSGIDYTHPDLSANIWKNIDEIPENDIDDDSNGYIDDINGWDFAGDSIFFLKSDNDPLDDSGHGTHCAGIVTAVTNNEIGIAGVCWNCKIMPLKGFVKIRGADTSLASAIVYAADNEADVVSMSWGSNFYSKLISNAIDYAYSKGVVLVGSAGNSNSDKKNYPAAYENVIAVAATDHNDDRAYFHGHISGSNYGSWVDVAAPGLYIYSTMPTYNVLLNIIGYNKNYDYLNGTSMACPIVAGLAAQLLSYNPDLNQDEVRNIIHDSTDWIVTDEYIGNGRINAYKALLLASDVTVPPNKPDPPSGQINGQIGKEYNYTAITIDPDEDDLYYLFSWGDKTYSDWIGPYVSGLIVNDTHKWDKQGNYLIKVKARDSYGLESDWSDPFKVSMPKTYTFNLLKHLLLRLLQLFPFFNEILN